MLKKYKELNVWQKIVYALFAYGSACELETQTTNGV